MISPHTIYSFFRFGLVGAMCSAVYAGVAWILHERMGQPPIIASVLAYIAAIPLSFAGQKFYAFKSTMAVTDELPRFVAVQIFNLILAGAAMFLITDIVGLPFWLGTLTVIALIPLTTFMMLSLVVFRNKPANGDKA